MSAIAIFRRIVDADHLRRRRIDFVCQVDPDVLPHWRLYPVNVLAPEVKKTTNTAVASRDVDRFKWMSFTAPELSDDKSFRCHVGLFHDILTGVHFWDSLLV